MFPNGPLIPPTGDFTNISISGLNTITATSGALTLTNDQSIQLYTQNGTISLRIGNIIYVWPTTTPPSSDFVLGINDIDEVDGVTTYTLTWVFGAICFHITSTTVLEDGSVVRMDELKYGDKVLSIDSNMKPVFSPIVDFTGVFPNRTGSYVKIYTNSGHVIMLSTIHLIRTENSFVQAATLQVGDKILTIQGLKEIIEIERGIEQGWYSPLTENGTIIVDGIVASCHTTNSHNLVRFMYKPLYWYLYWFPHKIGTYPVETEHWYSIKFRRGPIGKMIIGILNLFKWG